MITHQTCEEKACKEFAEYYEKEAIIYNLFLTRKTWTLSQGVFLVFGRVYSFQEIDLRKYYFDQSFYLTAPIIEDKKILSMLPQAKLYLKAARCIDAGVLLGTWYEDEFEYRVKRSDFLKWVATQDVELDYRILTDLRVLTRRQPAGTKEKIQLKAIEILDSFKKPVFTPMLIKHLRATIGLIGVDDKTLRNYLGEIQHPMKMKKGRPSKKSPQKCPFTKR